MERVLLTGMSGTGKSMLIRGLATRRYKAVDLDADEWSEWVPLTNGDPFVSPASTDSVWQSNDWV